MNEENFIVGGQCPHALRYADCSKCNKQQPTTDPTTEIDAEVYKHSTTPTGCVPSSFSRKLERERNEARAKRSNMICEVCWTNSFEP
jgi:hypothetical protein